jgi:hypothetical protein
VAIRTIQRGHTRKSRRNNLRFGLPSLRCQHSNVPGDYVIATVYSFTSGWAIDGLGNLQSGPKETDEQHDKWETLIVSETYGSTDNLLLEFRTGNLTTICDGSEKAGIGSAAWIINSPAIYLVDYIFGSVQSLVNKVEQSSHRPEYSGILGGLTQLSHLLDA